jgi:putative membrane protein
MLYTALIIIHLVSLVAWFAGLFYLPRLFVYHTQVQHEECYNLFCTMERKLYTIIMNPAMVIVVLSGCSLIINAGWLWFKHAPWLHAKLFFVLLLIGYHRWLGCCLKKFQKKINSYSETFFRVINEVPTVLLITIISLVKIKALF